MLKIILAVTITVSALWSYPNWRDKLTPECKASLVPIEKRLKEKDNSALQDLLEWEKKCKHPKPLKKGNLEPNPSNDKNF